MFGAMRRLGLARLTLASAAVGEQVVQTRCVGEKPTHAWRLENLNDDQLLHRAFASKPPLADILPDSWCKIVLNMAPQNGVRACLSLPLIGIWRT